MKRRLLFIILLLALNAPMVLLASDSKYVKDPVAIENKMSAEESARITKRVEEIRAMDKSKLTASERKELRKELRGYKESIKRDNTVIYISAGTLLVIILILLLI
jgi:Flp pilus assembly protein TadB